VRFEIVSAKSLTEVDFAMVAKRGDQFPGLGIDSIKKVPKASQDTAVASVGPISYASRTSDSGKARVELPKEFTRRGIECDDMVSWRTGVQNAPNDNWADFEATRFSGVVGPRNGKLGHVAAINLRKLRIVFLPASTAIRWPRRRPSILGEAISAEENA